MTAPTTSPVSRRLANPRRTTLATLSKGSELATCSGTDGNACHNVAVRVVQTPEGRRLLCRTCSEA